MTPLSRKRVKELEIITIAVAAAMLSSIMISDTITSRISISGLMEQEGWKMGCLEHETSVIPAYTIVQNCTMKYGQTTSHYINNYQIYYDYEDAKRDMDSFLSPACKNIGIELVGDRKIQLESCKLGKEAWIR